jgi:hypothetical protein
LDYDDNGSDRTASTDAGIFEADPSQTGRTDDAELKAVWHDERHGASAPAPIGIVVGVDGRARTKTNC